MLRVGLTGGVASGKSAVARELAARGAAVRDADEVVRRLYLPGGRGAAAAAALFGDRVLDAAGGVDHAELAAVALASATARRRLEGAIHPLVRDEVGAWLAALDAGASPPEVAVLEAALLVETGSHRAYHRLVTVSASEERRRARALAAGWSAEALARVVAAQLGDPAREAVADYVVRNDGTLAELRVAVDELWRLLRADAALLAAGSPLPDRRNP